MKDLELIEFLLQNDDFANQVQVTDESISCEFARVIPISRMDEYTWHTEREFSIENFRIVFPRFVQATDDPQPITDNL